MSYTSGKGKSANGKKIPRNLTLSATTYAVSSISTLGRLNAKSLRRLIDDNMAKVRLELAKEEVAEATLDTVASGPLSFLYAGLEIEEKQHVSLHFELGCVANLWSLGDHYLQQSRPVVKPLIRRLSYRNRGIPYCAEFWLGASYRLTICLLSPQISSPMYNSHQRNQRRSLCSFLHRYVIARH